MAWVHARLCTLPKGCIRLAAASDKVYQLLAHGRWFSPRTPASSTSKTGRHDIAEILLKVGLSTKYHQINHPQLLFYFPTFQIHMDKTFTQPIKGYKRKTTKRIIIYGR